MTTDNDMTKLGLNSEEVSVEVPNDQNSDSNDDDDDETEPEFVTTNRIELEGTGEDAAVETVKRGDDEEIGSYVLGETGQALGMFGYNFPKGVQNMTDMLLVEQDNTVGMMHNAAEWSADNAREYGGRFVEWLTSKVNNDYIPNHVLPAEQMRDKVNIYGAVSELMNKDSKTQAQHTEWRNDWTEWMLVKDREEGWVDETLAKGGQFAGELWAGGPTGKGAFRLAQVRQPRASVIDEAMEVAEKKGGLQKLTLEGDPAVTSIIKKRYFSTPSRMSEQVRDEIYTTIRALGIHTKASLDYGLAGGIGYTIGKEGSKIFDASEESSEYSGMGFSLVAMMMGTRSLIITPARAVGGGKLVEQVGKVPFLGIKTDGKKLTFGDLGRIGLGVRHLIRREQAVRAGDVYRANVHLLRYAGASKGDAAALAGNPEQMNAFINSSIDRGVMEDAVTFMDIMRNLADKHPEYYKYITEGQEAARRTQVKFNKLFIEDEQMAARLKDQFELELRQENELTGVYNNEQITDIVNKFELGDFTLMLDQIYMIDFISSMRNKTMSEAFLPTLKTKSALDLYAEGFQYNNALEAQLTLIESAMKALKTTSNDAEVLQFTEITNKSISRVRDDINTAREVIEDRVTQLEADAKGLSERNFRQTIYNMTGLNRFKNLKEGSKTNAEKNLYEGIRSRLVEGRLAKVEEYAVKYGEVDDVSISAAPLMELLDDRLFGTRVSASLGSIGKTTTQRVLETNLPNFKKRLRSNGLRQKFGIQELYKPGDMSDSEYVEVLIDMAAENNDMLGVLYTNIDAADPALLQKMKIDTSTTKAQNVLDENIKNPMERKELIKKLQDAMREDIEDVSKLPADTVEVNRVIDEFAEPQMTVRDARLIAQDLFRQARATSTTPSQKRELTRMGNDILHGIDEGADDAFGPEGLSSKLREISSGYKEDVIKMYRQGFPLEVFNHGMKIGERNPLPLKLLFEQIFEKTDPQLAAEQFNYIFPKGSEGREEAIDAMKYAFGSLLDRGKKLEDLGGRKTATDDFLENFKDILGAENLQKLRDYHAYIGNEYVMLPSDIMDDMDTIRKSLARMGKQTDEIFKNSPLVNEFSENVSFNDLEQLIFSRTAGRKMLRGGDAIEDTRIARKLNRLNKAIGREDEATDFKGLIDESQFPLAKTGEPLTGDVLEELIKLDPNLKEPLQNVALQVIINNSFEATDMRTIDPVSKSLTTKRQLNIDKFADNYKKYIPTFKKFFEPKQLERLQVLFESGVASQGKNEALKIMNLATEPTTSSRASRLFALQRKVVGMPYLATEQGVMAFQREKAAFLKRIVLDPEFGQLLINLSVDRKPTTNNVIRFLQAVRVTYPDAEIDDKEQSAFILKELKNNWDIFENPDNFTIDLDKLQRVYGVDMPPDKLLQYKRFLTEKNLPLKYTQGFASPVMSPYLSPELGMRASQFRTALRAMPKEAQKNLEKAAELSRLETANEVQAKRRTAILKELLSQGKNATSNEAPF